MLLLVRYRAARKETLRVTRFCHTQSSTRLRGLEGASLSESRSRRHLQEAARTLCALPPLRKSGNTDAASFQSCRSVIKVILALRPLINEPVHVFSLLCGWVSGSPFQFAFQFPKTAPKKAWECCCTTVQPLDVRDEIYLLSMMHLIRDSAPV